MSWKHVFASVQRLDISNKSRCQRMPLAGFKCPMFEHCNTSKDLRKHSIELKKQQQRKPPSCWVIAIWGAQPRCLGLDIPAGMGRIMGGQEKAETEQRSSEVEKGRRVRQLGSGRSLVGLPHLKLTSSAVPLHLPPTAHPFPGLAQ